MNEHWNLKRELEKADYKIKQENPQHGCPYCGNLNRQHRYGIKMQYSKCEECKKIFKNRAHGRL